MAAQKKWMVVTMTPRDSVEELRYWAHNCDYLLASGILSRLRKMGWRAIRVAQSGHHDTIMPSRCPTCVSDSSKVRALLKILGPVVEKEVPVGP
jgi:hypothetical protein